MLISLSPLGSAVERLFHLPSVELRTREWKQLPTAKQLCSGPECRLEAQRAEMSFEVRCTGSSASTLPGTFNHPIIYFPLPLAEVT
jgi:hypothetical protein